MTPSNFYSPNDEFYYPKHHKRKQPERELQNAIIQLLNAKGHFVFRTPNRGFQMPRSGAWIPSALPGLPDIIGVQKDTGRFIGIEVKIKGGKPSEAQNAFLETIRAKNGLAVVAYSLSDIEFI